MSAGPTGYAFNRTRQTYLATSVRFARTHWSRLVGLLGTAAGEFTKGTGLWIEPSHGVHTLGMRFPIDVIYLSGDKRVVHMERSLRPWRIAPVSMQTASVLELPGSTLERTGTAVGDEIEIAEGAAEAAKA